MTSLDAAPTAVVGDAAHGYGYLPGAPYDRGILTCSVREIPPAVIGQIRRQGVLVLPFAPLFGGRRRRLADGAATGPFTGSSAFMRMRQQRYQAPPVDDCLPGDRPGNAAQEYTTLNPLEVVDDWPASFVVGLAVPDVYYRRSDGSGMTTLWVFDTGVTSWATVDFVDGASRFEVRQSGPRRMWSEVEESFQWWVGEGRHAFADHTRARRGAWQLLGAAVWSGPGRSRAVASRALIAGYFSVTRSFGGLTVRIRPKSCPWRLRCWPWLPSY
ncbi:hypothetical protein ACFVVA_38090 [Kitasatospora sp. NPDC058048]|uniref:hypothetical protein n=1 Tax=Kitasatospora sp. NPDC058048 TaxID=3346313 RepID=UPI0036DE0D9B